MKFLSLISLFSIVTVWGRNISNMQLRFRRLRRVDFVERFGVNICSHSVHALTTSMTMDHRFFQLLALQWQCFWCGTAVSFVYTYVTTRVVRRNKTRWPRTGRWSFESDVSGSWRRGSSITWVEKLALHRANYGKERYPHYVFCNISVRCTYMLLCYCYVTVFAWRVKLRSLCDNCVVVVVAVVSLALDLEYSFHKGEWEC